MNKSFLGFLKRCKQICVKGVHVELRITISKLVWIILILGCVQTAQAQYADIEGTFKSDTTSLELINLDSESGVIAASAFVGLPGGCSGTVAGIGKMVGNVLEFKPYKKEEGSEDCTITVKFNKKHNKATIEEGNCGPYHGMGCGWEGQTIWRKK